MASLAAINSLSAYFHHHDDAFNCDASAAGSAGHLPSNRGAAGARCHKGSAGRDSRTAQDRPPSQAAARSGFIRVTHSGGIVRAGRRPPSRTTRAHVRAAPESAAAGPWWQAAHLSLMLVTELVDSDRLWITADPSLMTLQQLLRRKRRLRRRMRRLHPRRTAAGSGCGNSSCWVWLRQQQPPLSTMQDMLDWASSGPGRPGRGRGGDESRPGGSGERAARTGLGQQAVQRGRGGRPVAPASPSVRVPAGTAHRLGLRIASGCPWGTSWSQRPW